MGKIMKLFGSSKSESAVHGPVGIIIAGLGNPGREYENTRHNAGYLAIDMIAEKYGAKINKIKFKSLCGECMIGGVRALLLKPSTYMNLSGEAVREAMAFYKIPPEKTVIIFDDISLTQGRVRIRKKGSDGGHNGIKNIIYLTGSDNFPRIKIGVGAKPNADYDLKDWVLSKFSDGDMKEMQEAFKKASEAVEFMAEGKYDEAMNKYNR